MPGCFSRPGLQLRRCGIESAKRGQHGHQQVVEADAFIIGLLGEAAVQSFGQPECYAPAEVVHRRGWRGHTPTLLLQNSSSGLDSIDCQLIGL